VKKSKTILWLEDPTGETVDLPETMPATPRAGPFWSVVSCLSRR
jgi:hypothetical protein